MARSGSPTTRAPDTGPRWWCSPRLVFGAAGLLAAGVGFAPTLHSYFVGDDFGYVGRYFGFPLAQWPHLFVHGWADGMSKGNELHELRPLNALLFILNGRVWGLDPFGFHVANVLLHSVCAALVGHLAWRVTDRQRACGVAAAVLFALHPVQAEAVAWISGCVDLLATAFVLAGFIAFLDYRASGDWRPLAATAIFQAAAIFTKESGYTFPLLLFAADLLWRHPPQGWRALKSWAPYAACAVVIGVYSFCRLAAFGHGGIGGVGHGLPNPVSGATYVELFHRQADYLSQLFVPAHAWLRSWSYAGWPLQPLPVARAALLIALFLAAFAAVWRWRLRTASDRAARTAGVFFGVAWYLVCTVPLLMTYYSARHLYPAVAGYSVATVLLLRVVAPVRFNFAIVTAALAIFYAANLAPALSGWRAGARLSHEIAGEVAHVARDIAPGATLVLDVPDLVDGGFCWSFAVPYSIRPPFIAERLDERIGVLAGPSIRAFSARESRSAAISRLLAAHLDGWLVRVGADGHAQRIAVPAAKLRAAAQRFVATSSGPASGDAWPRFTADLAAP